MRELETVTAQEDNKCVSKTDSHKMWLDVVRVVAMFAVILNHSWGYFSCDNYDMYQGTWIYYLDLCLNAFTRCNVPLFIMISGCLMLDDERNSSIYKIWINNIKKVLVPLVVWTFIYCTLNAICAGKSLVHELAVSVIHPNSYAEHLWYLYMLIPLYAVTPLLIQIVKAGEKYIDYMLVIWLVYSVGYPLINHFVPQIRLVDYADLNMGAGYIGFYFLGYKLGKSSKKSSRARGGYCIKLVCNGNFNDGRMRKNGSLSELFLYIHVSYSCYNGCKCIPVL